MCSRTIVLAVADGAVEDLVRKALESADVEIATIFDGESVIDLFLFSRRTVAPAPPAFRAGGRWRNLCAQRRCDLLLLDLALPKLDGLKVLRQLRWLYRDDFSRLPPIVMLSDSDENRLVAAAYRNGCSGFLNTSAPPSLFSAALQQTVGYWLDATVVPALRDAPLVAGCIDDTIRVPC